MWTSHPVLRRVFALATVSVGLVALRFNPIAVLRCVDRKCFHLSSIEGVVAIGHVKCEGPKII